MNNNFLFVCSANIQRSKTGEDYFSQKHNKLNFESAGTNIKLSQKEGTNLITEEMLIWADIIFVMEQKHLRIINENTENKYIDKIVLLSIEDKYKYYQKELIEILIDKTKKYF